MSRTAGSVSDAVRRLADEDATLKYIKLWSKTYSAAELDQLVDVLLARPDAVTHVYLGWSRLLDETAAKLAHYVAASTSIEWLDFNDVLLSESSYLMLAAALRTNTSLRMLHLSGNGPAKSTRVEAAFVDALRVNPCRPTNSLWYLNTSARNDFDRLRRLAVVPRHPTLLSLLVPLL